MFRKRKIIHLIFIILVLLQVTGCTITNDLATSDNVTTVSYMGFGALETVGGSLHNLCIGSNNYIIDVGSFYGDEE